MTAGAVAWGGRRGSAFNVSDVMAVRSPLCAGVRQHLPLYLEWAPVGTFREPPAKPLPTVNNDINAAALPEPAETDPLLGNLSTAVRQKVRERFIDALERIYNPQPTDCAKEYLLGHAKGESRAKLLLHLAQVQASGSAEAKDAARRLSAAREALDDAKAKTERLNNLPKATKDIRERLDVLNTQNQEISRKLGSLENEIKKLKADLHTLNEEIGRIQEELARLGPEQKRIAVS